MFNSKKEAIKNNTKGNVIVYFKNEKKWRSYSRLSKNLRNLLFQSDFSQFTEWEKNKCKKYHFEV